MYLMIHILEMYLEELSGRIEEVSVECQTDMFLDKPATPLFIPAKTGRDAATQIEEGEVDSLFCQILHEYFISSTVRAIRHNKHFHNYA